MITFFKGVIVSAAMIIIIFKNLNQNYQAITTNIHYCRGAK